MKSLQEIKQEFIEIIADVAKIAGLSLDSAVVASAAILQEYGKYSRTQQMSSPSKFVGNGKSVEPATVKQKNILSKYKIPYSNDITKAEASVILDKVIGQSSSNKKGRFSSAPFIK